GAAPLSWDDGLAASAQSWASACNFAHTNGALGQVGENLAAGTFPFTASAAVGLFTSDKPGSLDAFTHWTQVTWKSTIELGCAAAVCPNIFPRRGVAVYHVCLYNPVGNVIGQEA
ncbi:hypothetical protein PHLGIDRAFT_61427, partial [Phlebiopsis gigantea 11061_1 CR5-6]